MHHIVYKITQFYLGNYVSDPQQFAVPRLISTLSKHSIEQRSFTQHYLFSSVVIQAAQCTVEKAYPVQNSTELSKKKLSTTLYLIFR